MRFHEIIEGRLYQSAHPLNVPPDELERELAARDIRTVVGMWGRPLNTSGWAGRRYLHRPMPDGKHLDFIAVTVTAETAASGEGGILTYCQAGRNRSGLMSALIARELLGITGREAVELVRAGRPRALANATFTSYLEGLE